MNEQIRCIIVDDEPVARSIIRNYCGHLPVIDVAGEFGNALEAREFLSKHQVDLIFLDIEMPVLNGISFLNTLKIAPQVIFTTAYQEYAVNAFDLAACDYLLKPFSLDRFIIAVDKAKEKLSKHHASPPSQIEKDYLLLKAEGRIYQVPFHDCLYAEAQGNYTLLVTINSVIKTKMSFSNFAELLPADVFVRVHRSFIVNKTKITHIEGNRVFIQQKEIPIGSGYKELFLKHIDL